MRADNAGARAPGDTTTLLRALLDQKDTIDGLILFHLPDAEAVEAIMSTDVGTTVTLVVGGKRDTRVANTVFKADCPGASCYDFSRYDYTRVSRPLYPLDPDMQWQMSD